MSACLNLFFPLSDRVKWVLETALLVVAALALMALPIAVPLPDPEPIGSGFGLPLIFQSFALVFAAGALLFFAAMRVTNEFRYDIRLLLFLLSTTAVLVWVFAYYLPCVLWPPGGWKLWFLVTLEFITFLISFTGFYVSVFEIGIKMAKEQVPQEVVSTSTEKPV